MSRSNSLRRLGAVLLPLLFTACATRSISNTARPWGNDNTTYAGELNDFDVVGRKPHTMLSGMTQLFHLKTHAKVLVVQSGAMFPDESMMAALGEHFEVASASGHPARSASDEGMRGAAERGGFDAVVAYWGVLESAPRPTEGAALSWVPVLGFFLNDERQLMRIRLRIVVLDAHTGAWRSLLSAPLSDERDSSLVTRLSTDLEQVSALKDASYRAAAQMVAALAAD